MIVMKDVNRGSAPKTLILLLAVALVFAFSTGTARAANEAPGGSPAVAAPDFELMDLQGKAVKLSSFKDQKPVLVYFWATWCPYCLASKPKVLELRNKIPQSEMEIIGINVGGADTLDRLKRFQESHPVPYPIVFDKDGSVSRTYQVQGIPLFVIVNKKGNIVYRENTVPADPKQFFNR